MLRLIILLSFTNGMEIQVISDMHRHEILLTIELQKTDTVATLKANITEKLKEIFKNKDGIPQQELSLRYSEELKEILKNQTDDKKQKTPKKQADISSPEEQSLAYYKKGKGVKLNDSQTLEECGIVNNVEMVYLELIEFKIFIEHKGTSHSFSVLADDFVKSLKEKIMQKLGIPLEDQILTRQKDGHVLTAELSKMYYYDIVIGTCLSLTETPEFGIFIEHQGTTHSFRVNADESVKSLKEKIMKMTKIRLEDQILTRPDGHVLWEESTTIKHHNIVRGTCLSLNEIKVQYDGNSFNIEVEKATETVKDLKEKVIKKIKKTNKIKIKELSLKDEQQQDKILEDDNQTIAFYKIQGPLTVENAKIKERKRDIVAKTLHIHNSKPAQKRK
ncbi:hypothetical protein niasHT_025177 [Heterodera trifolii]|uniref:Ubiquitin-like domain-containing protein n=1 Tax=Heterodera trifolii TaxID=157864 RepID=A0ABD2JLB4_9BILA